MKRFYESAEMEVIFFESEAIDTLFVSDVGSGDETDLPF